MITYEFSEAVKSKNILMIRIMLKDSLLIDKSFSMFEEMRKYAESNGVNFWMEEIGELEMAEKPWTIDLMNYELVALINDFTKRHLRYVIAIIEYIYGSNRTVENEKNSFRKQTKNNQNGKNYEIILNRAGKINQIVNKSKKKGWTYEDIDDIRHKAEEICKACENIGRRR